MLQRLFPGPICNAETRLYNEEMSGLPEVRKSLLRVDCVPRIRGALIGTELHPRTRLSCRRDGADAVGRCDRFAGRGCCAPVGALPREEAERNQRERLFAAMVATVAEKGYEATTVADLVKLSGVSRSAFYRHFEDKQECFLTAAEALIEPTLELMEQRRARARLRRGAHRAGARGLPEADRRPAGGGEDVLRRGLRGRARGRGGGRPHPRRLREVRRRRSSSRSPAARRCRRR